jgi:hypothetical protein
VDWARLCSTCAAEFSPTLFTPQAVLSGQGSALASLREQKVYINFLRVAPLELVLTFLPAPFQPDPGGGC